MHADTGLQVDPPLLVRDSKASTDYTLRAPTKLERELAPRPDGLVLVVDRPTKTLDGAVLQALRGAEDFVATLALSAGAAIGSVKPLLVYDATPGRNRRPFRQYLHHLGARHARRLDHVRAADILRRLVAVDRRDERERIGDAITHAARSAAELDAVNGFSRAWAALERLNPPLRDRYAQPKNGVVHVTCSTCKTETDVAKPELTGIRHFIGAVLGEADLWKELRYLRVALQHGTQPLDVIRDKAVHAADRARFVVARAVERLLELPEASLDLQPHALATVYCAGGCYLTELLPPPDETDEPYFRGEPELVAGPEGVARFRAMMKPTFDFPFVVDEVGVLGTDSRTIDRVDVRSSS